MKAISVISIVLILFLISCSKKKEEIPDFEKPYRLTAEYEGIGEPGLAYVCHITNEFVSVIDSKTNELVGKIPGGKGTTGICFSPDKKTGYITNWNSYNLTIFDARSNKSIETVIAGEHPVEMITVLNGKYLLISHESTEGIWVMNTEDYKMIKKLGDCTGPMYYIENENKIYQPQIFTPYIDVIDPQKLEVVKKIETGGRPMGMAFSGHFAYLANYDSNEVAKYDTKSDSVLLKIKNIKNPRGIEAAPNGKYVYVTNVVENTVTVISTSSDTVQSVITGFKMPTSVAFSKDGKFAYVTNQGQSTVAVIDAKEHKIIKSISVAGNPINVIVE